MGRRSPGVILPFNKRAKSERGYQLLRDLQHGLSAPAFPHCTFHHICSSVTMEVIHNASLVTIFSLFVLSPIILVSKFYLDSSAEGQCGRQALGECA